MTDRAKVIQLEPEIQRQSRARLARLPASVHAVHEKGKTLVLDLLRSFFEQADDSLFDLADRALNNQEQNIYFDSMREVRVQRRNIEKRFAESIDEAFAALTAAQSPNVAEARDEHISAESLALVQNDELEEMVAMDSSIARANNAFAEAVQQISLRLDSLVPVKVYQKNNPLGPDVICAAFMNQAKRLEIDIKAKLVLFKLFDKTVVNQMGEVYKTINQILIDHNVLPSLQGTNRPQRPEATPSHVPASESMAQYYRPSAGSTNPELLAILQQVLGDEVFHSGGAQSQGSNMEPHQEFQIPAGQAQLLNLLSLAQRMPAVQEHSAKASVNVQRLLGALEQKRGVQADVGRVDSEVINLVTMLFEFILEDRSLAAPMKALISRLQIPILKVAIVDKTFFTKGGHAARRLLNEMSSAALGWHGDVDGKKKDPLYEKMQDIVDRLLTDFDADVGIFSELLIDFTSFLEKEKRRAAVLERRTLDAEDGKARAELARNRVNAEVESRIEGRQLPSVVDRLVKDAWSNVLFVTALKYGYDSKEWQQGIATLDELLWSVQPPQSGDDRQRLIKLVPILLKQLRAGLDTISYNPFEMSELFKALQATHLACIKGQPVAVESDSVLSEPADHDMDNVIDRTIVPAPVALSNDVVDGTPAAVQNVEAVQDIQAPQAPANEARVNKALEEEGDLPDDDPHMRQVEGFSQGSWFEMHIDDSSNPARCRLAAFIKPLGKYIFVNRNGMKVAEKNRSELARALKQGSLRPLDNSILFDRALETVITSLRK